jgi:hypothetical protein
MGGNAVVLSHVPKSSPTEARAPVRAFLKRTARAVRIVVGHKGIPRPIRWLAGFALLPIPGPFDEAVLLVVAAILFLFYRAELRQAWKDAAEK